MPLILVLHPDVVAQAALIDQVTQLGFECTDTFALPEGDEAAHPQPDVILMSIAAEADAWRRRVEWFKVKLPTKPLIVLSQDATLHRVMLAMAAGAYDYVQSPTQDGRLYASITRALEWHELRQSMTCLGDQPLASLRCKGDPMAVGAPTVDHDAAIIKRLDELERQAIAHAMDVCNRSAVTAASKLGISSATIYRKLKAYGIPTR